VFDVAASRTLSDTQKRRVMSKEGPRITAIAQDARPPRPAQVWPNEKVWWRGGAWQI